MWKNYQKSILQQVRKINMNAIIEKITNLIYPQRCGFCNQRIKVTNPRINEEYTCKKCKKNLEYICINEVILGEEKDFYTACICAYSYAGMIRKKLLQFKFKNKKYLYRTLAEHLLEILKIYQDQIDVVIAVPISWKRFLERGYNQADLIANFLAKSLHKKQLQYVLVKQKNNSKQSQLNLQERSLNVANVYSVLQKEKIKGKNILLIDDILTTGATVRECSKVLKENGAKKIIVAVVAKTQMRKNNF